MKSIEFWDKEECAKHCYWESEKIINYFQEKNIDTISYLDIGANVGKIYDLISEKLNVKKCVLYEASTILSNYMFDKFKDFPNVIVNNCAVSNFNGFVKVNQSNVLLSLESDEYKCDHNLGVSNIIIDSDGDVPVKSISNILNEDKDFYSKIDVIKIDTETVDYLILDDMFDFVSNMETMPLICFEHNYMFSSPSVTKTHAKKIYEKFINILGYDGPSFEELSGDVFIFPNKKNDVLGVEEQKNVVLTHKKTKIQVHNPCNSITRYYRYYNYFWDEFTDKLKEFFDVKENRFFDRAHIERYNIELEKGISGTIPLLECEYIIENMENGEFVVLSVSDLLTHAILNEKENPYLKKVLVSQFQPKEILAHVGNKMYKYSPWSYFKSSMVDLEPYHKKRLGVTEFINKMYFRGTSLEDREILNYIDKNIITDFKPIAQESYYNDIIQYKLALSVDGRGEFCYRDIECLALGIPMIRFEYVSKFYDELIPNYHYISIPRPDDLTLYRMGNEHHAKLIESRFFEVVNDEDFLNFISKNGREYYEKNCSLNNMINKTINLLNIKDWL